MPRPLLLIIALSFSALGSFAASTAPGDFRIAQLFAFNNSANLAWTNNAPDAYGYEIYRSASANGSYVFHTDVSTPNPVTTIYLTAQQAFGTYFKIRARTFDAQNGYGTTGFSPPILISFIGAGRQVLSNAGASGAVPEYLVSLPRDYDTRPYHFPVLIYLHGSDAVGGSAATLLSSGPPKLVNELDPVLAQEFIVISPHMATGGVEQWYDPSRSNVVLDILDDVLLRYKSDNLRTYLIGSDLGGTGALGFYSKFPNQFAAMAEAGGSGAGVDTNGYVALQGKPLWIHHGTADATVPFAQAEAIAQQFNNWNSGLLEDEYNSTVFDTFYDSNSARFSVYTGFGHDVWTTMYSDHRVYYWMLNRTRPFQGPNIYSANVGGDFNALTPVTMNVGASGERLKFRWLKDGVPISGATTDTFNIPAPTTDDQGDYEIEVSNRDGVSHYHGNLNVYKLYIDLTAPPTPISFQYGTPLTASLFNSLIITPNVPGELALDVPNFEGEILQLNAEVRLRFYPTAQNTYHPATFWLYPEQTDRPATITAPNITQVYGPEVIVTLIQQGVLARDLDAVDSSFGVTSTTVLESVGVHTYTPRAFYAIPGYQFTCVSGTLTITPAPLTISANNQVRVAGQPNPAFTANYSGFSQFYRDNPTKLTSQPVFTTTATPNSPPGEYPIFVSGAASPNYAISYVAGTLTITNEPPIIYSNSILGFPSDPVVNQYVHWGVVAGDPDNHALTYTWDFGDGSPTSSEISPQHIYAAPGRYTVSVAISDGYQTVTQDTLITVGVSTALPPVAGFSTSDVVGFAGLPLTFNGVPSLDARYSILDYAWNFGDGTVGNGVIVDKTYDTAGTYVVTLSVRYGDGFSLVTSSVSRSIVVVPAEQAGSLKPNVEFTTSLDRKSSNRDTLQLKARLNIGAEKLAVGSPVVLEIARQRFEATLDRRLRATVKAAPQQIWKVRWGSRSQDSGETEVQLTIKNANLNAWAEPVPPLPKHSAAGFFAPLRLQIGSHSVEVNCGGYLISNRTDTRLSGKGELNLK